MIRNILRTLFAPDPAWIRTKRGLRIALAAGLGAGAVYFVSPQNTPWACILAMLSQQGSYGYTKTRKFWAFLLASLFYTGAFFLGLLVVGSPILSAAALIIFGFLAFYIRRFGPVFALFPIFAWVVLLFAALAPIPHSTPMENLLSIAIILGISGFISVFIFRENKQHLFFENITHSFALYQQLFQCYAKALKKAPVLESCRSDSMALKTALKKRLFDNQTIAGDLDQHKSQLALKTSSLVLVQYSLTQTANLISEGLFRALYDEKMPWSADLQRQFFTLFHALSTLCSHIKLEKETLVLPPAAESVEKRLHDLKSSLTHQSLFDPHIAFSFLVYTGVDNFYKRLATFINRGVA
jgi:hypothetical protein